MSTATSSSRAEALQDIHRRFQQKFGSSHSQTIKEQCERLAKKRRIHSTDISSVENEITKLLFQTDQDKDSRLSQLRSMSKNTTPSIVSEVPDNPTRASPESLMSQSVHYYYRIPDSQIFPTHSISPQPRRRYIAHHRRASNQSPYQMSLVSSGKIPQTRLATHLDAWGSVVKADTLNFIEEMEQQKRDKKAQAADYRSYLQQQMADKKELRRSIEVQDQMHATQMSSFLSEYDKKQEATHQKKKAKAHKAGKAMLRAAEENQRRRLQSAQEIVRQDRKIVESEIKRMKRLEDERHQRRKQEKLEQHEFILKQINDKKSPSPVQDHDTAEFSPAFEKHRNAHFSEIQKRANHAHNVAKLQKLHGRRTGTQQSAVSRIKPNHLSLITHTADAEEKKAMAKRKKHQEHLQFYKTQMKDNQARDAEFTEQQLEQRQLWDDEVRQQKTEDLDKMNRQHQQKKALRQFYDSQVADKHERFIKDCQFSPEEKTLNRHLLKDMIVPVPDNI